MLTAVLQSATECSSTTLEQIIDLYVQLQKHDGVDVPAPLFLSLSTKIKFSHRFEYLLSALAEGKGLSQLMLLESPEGDQHLDNQAKQEDVQGSYRKTSKPTFTPELDVDPPGGVDADENAESEPNLTQQQFEDLMPHPQHFDSGGQTDIPAAEEHFIADHARQTEENPTTTGPSDAFNGGSNNIHQAEDQINGPFQSGLSSISVTNKDQDTVGERDSKYYQDNDNLNPGSSTGSSTIQGDIREMTVDSSNPAFREPTSTTKEKDVTAARRDFESDPTAGQVGGPSSPSFLNDAIEDDFDIAAHIETTKERPTDNAVHSEDQKLRDEPQHRPETNSVTDHYGYGQHPQESRKSSIVSEQESHLSVESSFDEDHNSSYTLINSSIDPRIPRTGSTELDIQRSAGSEAVAFEFDEANIEKNRHTHDDSNEYLWNNATDSFESDRDGTDGVLTGQYGNRAIHEFTSQHLRSTSDAQEKLADSDEITYEDDDEPGSSKVYGPEQDQSSSPGLLKRLRSDDEDHDETDNNIQGRFNPFMSLSQLITV